MLTETRERCFEHVPYSDLTEGILQTWDGSLSTGFYIQPVDVECADEGQLDDVAAKLVSLVNDFSPDFQYEFISRNSVRSGDSKRYFSVWVQVEAPKQRNVPLLKTKLALEMIGTMATDLQAKIREGKARLRTALES